MSTKDVIKSSVLEGLTGGTYLDVSTILGILFFAAVISSDVALYVISKIS